MTSQAAGLATASGSPKQQAMVEPRLRTFLVDMLTWLDDRPPSLADIRAHVQDTLTRELQQSTPKKRSRPDDDLPQSSRLRSTPEPQFEPQFGQIKISYGPLEDSSGGLRL